MHKTIGIGIVYFITCVFGLLWQAGQVAVFLWQTLFVQRPKHSNVEDLHLRQRSGRHVDYVLNKLAQSANSPCFTLSCFAPTYNVPILPVTFNPLPLCMVPPRVFYPYPPRADVIVMERAKRVWAHVDLPDAKCSLLQCSKPEMGAGITRMIYPRY